MAEMGFDILKETNKSIQVYFNDSEFHLISSYQKVSFTCPHISPRKNYDSYLTFSLNMYVLIFKKM